MMGKNTCQSITLGLNFEPLVFQLSNRALPFGDVLHVVVVDLIDDLQVTRQDMFQHTDWPALEGFW